MKIMFLTFAVLIFSQISQATCLLPDYITEKNYQDNREACLGEARYLFEPVNPNALNFQTNLLNPKVKNFNIPNGKEVYCRFYFQPANGKSAKFRCLQTNEQNQLLDSDGNVVFNAVGAKDDAKQDTYLVNTKGERIPHIETDGSTKSFKQAFLLKVRYHDGTSRSVENFVTVAASRILWALGVPTHTNLMTSRVVCYGCDANPVRQKKVVVDNKGKYAVASVPHASIEFKIKAKRIYKANTDAWTWTELNQIYKNSVQPKVRVELEVLALVNQFLGYTSDKSMQHAIVCNKKDAAEKVCLEPFAMVHDIGAAFGDRESGFGVAPRGSVEKYEKYQIFNPWTCTFSYTAEDGSLPFFLTHAGQLEFLKRAEVLTPEVLRSIISASHIGYYQANPSPSRVANRDQRWVTAILAKLEEIRRAPCR